MSRNEILGEIAAEFGEPSLVKHKHLVNWFEIPYLNGRRSRAFYEYVFDIQLKMTDSKEGVMYQFPMNFLSAGASGTLRKGVPSVDGTTVYFTTKNLPLTVQKVLTKGGKVIKPIYSLGEHGYAAIVMDIEGNKIGLHAYSL